MLNLPRRIRLTSRRLYNCQQKHHRFTKHHVSYYRSSESHTCDTALPKPAELNPGVYESSLKDGEIRLLIILPGSRPEEIQCSFRTEPLLNQPEYTAISYCWGETVFERTIQVDTKRFRLSENLYNILLDLRRPAESITVWVDFFSINQSCTEEKSLQVGKMHTIYKGAKQVIAFLGHHQDGSDFFFQILKDVESEDVESEDVESKDVESKDVESQGVHTSLLHLSEHKEGTIKKAWEKVLMRKYWSRAWIIQEIIFGQANDLQLRCGSDQISYKTMKNFELPLRSMGNSNTNGPRIVVNRSYNIPTRWELLDSIRNSTMSFRDFLHAFLDCSCSDPRDNIFAFTHLLDMEGIIEVDYEKPPEIIIPHTFRLIIEHTQSLCILLLRGRQKIPTAPGDRWQHLMPSWCPFVGTPYINHHTLDDSQELPKAKHASIAFDNHNRLHCQGIIVGRVARIQKSRTRAGRANIKRPAPNRLQELMEFATCTNKKVKLSNRISSWQDLVDTRLDVTSSYFITSKPGAPGPDAESYCFWDRLRFFTSSLGMCAFEWNASLPESIISKIYRPRDVAFVPKTARKGDYLCALSGCEAFVVLRRVDTHYKVIGEAFISCAEGQPSLPCAPVLDGRVKLNEIIIG